MVPLIDDKDTYGTPRISVMILDTSGVSDLSGVSGLSSLNGMMNIAFE